MSTCLEDSILPHQLRMKKISGSNFSESTLKSMEDFLNQRTQNIEVNDKQSE